MDAGFATPEAALQTRGWTVLNADRKRFKESLFITEDGKKIFAGMLEQMIAGAPDPEKAREEIRAQGLTFEDAMLFPMIAQNKNKVFAGYQILSRQSPSADETILEVETQMVSGSPHRETMKFRRFDNDWKVVVDEEMIRSNSAKSGK